MLVDIIDINRKCQVFFFHLFKNPEMDKDNYYH
jgi:hypothetical protein